MSQTAAQVFNLTEELAEHTHQHLLAMLRNEPHDKAKVRAEVSATLKLLCHNDPEDRKLARALRDVQATI